MRNYLMICFLILGAGVQSANGTLPPGWKKSVTLELKDGATDVLVAVPFDAELYRMLDEDFSSLRILDGRGNEVSYKVIVEADTRTRTTEKSWRADSVELDVTDEQLTVEMTLKEDTPSPTKIDIRTPLDNFQQRVRLYGVKEDDERLLVDDVIFDYSRYMDVRRTVLKFPAAEFRRFRVVFADPTSEQESRLLQLTRQLQADQETSRQERFAVEHRPFRIDEIRFISSEQQQVPDQPLITNWDIEVTQKTTVEKTGLSLIEFDAGHLPLTEVTLETSSRKFSRRVRLESSTTQFGKIEWNLIEEGRLSHFQFGEYDSKKLTLTFPEHRESSYRLVIENRDSEPLKIDGLKAAGHRHQMVFLADEGQQYEIHYDIQGRSPPNYDTAAIELMLSEGVVPQLGEAGPEIELSVSPLDRYWNFGRVINNPVLLLALVGILVLLLGWSLYQASKKLNDVDRGAR